MKALEFAVTDDAVTGSVVANILYLHRRNAGGRIASGFKIAEVYLCHSIPAIIDELRYYQGIAALY